MLVSFKMTSKVSALHIQRAGGKEFQISGAATLRMQTNETD